jgi:RecA/RadA recombinase
MRVRLPLDRLKTSGEPTTKLRMNQLDSVLGSVLARGQISLLHGPERAPLTYLAHTITIDSAIESSEGVSIFVDSGSNYSPALARSLCNAAHYSQDVLSRIVVANVLSLSELEEIAVQMTTLDKVNIAVLDSLTGVLNLTGAPGSKGRQRALFQSLETLRKIVNKLEIHLVLTDHSSRNWDSGRLTPIGGNVLAHAVDSVLRVDKLDVGQDMVRILVERSPLPPKSESVIVRTSPTGTRKIG